MVRVLITHGKNHSKVNIKTEGGTKIIVHDRYGTYSTYLPKGGETIGMVGCGDLDFINEPKNYKIIIGGDEPWEGDWKEDYITNLTRAQAKAILRHKAKEIKKWEEEHQMMYPNYYFAYRKVYENNCWNEPQVSWEPIEL